MLQSGFKAPDIFGRILRVELERQVLHVFTDQRFYFACLWLGKHAKILWDLDYEILVVFGKFKCAFSKFCSSEIRNFVDELFIEVNALDSCEKFFLDNFSSEHFRKGLMTKTNSEDFEFWVVLDGLFESLNEANNFRCFIVDWEWAARENNRVEIHVVLDGGVLLFEDVVSFPLVALVEEDAGEESDEMHFGFEEIGS